MIAATNSWLVCFDNLDHVPSWLANALCRLATGGGFATRRQYTDDAEILFEAMRPTLLTGIEELTTRGDLLDRAILLHLPAIRAGRRRAEAEFWEDFGKAYPGLLAALLDLLVRALALLPTMSVRELPRMADFARFGIAVEKAAGWPPGAFLKAYRANRETACDLTLEATLVAAPLRDFVMSQDAWTGTATELLDILTQRVDRRLTGKREWPRTPTALGGLLRRLAPTLRTVGVDVVFHRGARHRIIHLEREQAGEPSSSAS
jgi:hypothetical protein